MIFFVTPKNKEQRKALKAFLTSLKIGFHSEKDEEKALHLAMLKGRKTPLLSKAGKSSFLKSLKQLK